MRLLVTAITFVVVVLAALVLILLIPIVDTALILARRLRRFPAPVPPGQPAPVPVDCATRSRETA